MSKQTTIDNLSTIQRKRKYLLSVKSRRHSKGNGRVRENGAKGESVSEIVLVSPDRSCYKASIPKLVSAFEELYSTRSQQTLLSPLHHPGSTDSLFSTSTRDKQVKGMNHSSDWIFLILSGGGRGDGVWIWRGGGLWVWDCWKNVVCEGLYRRFFHFEIDVVC